MNLKRCFSLLLCICLLSLSVASPVHAELLPNYFVSVIVEGGNTWINVPYNQATGYYETNKLIGYEGKKFVAMALTITRNGLPRSGTYGVWFDAYEGNIASWNNVSRSRVQVIDYATNVEQSNGTAVTANHVHDTSGTGKLSWSGNVTIGYNTERVRLIINFNQAFSHLDIRPTGYNFKFTEAGGAAGTAISPEIENSGSSGVDNAIANNTGTLVEQQEETNGLLVQIISTISNQLTAFWNQLAGEFTNLFNKMNQQHQEKLDADRENTGDIIDELGDNTTNLINNNNFNTDKITQNQDENTDQILNGYDSSDLDSSSNNLNDTLTEYNDLENSITESMGSHLEEFEYNDISGYPSGVLASLLFFGNYTQDIFETIGNFNLPITLGLTLTFVLMLIGYFRYGR